MIDILLHPGFHKTGTSSIQHFLWTNRDRLSPVAVPVMLRHLKPVVRMACRYARHQNPIELIDMVPALDAALMDADPASGQSLIVSCEGLLGHLPGWPGVDSYAAAPVLVSYLTGYFQDRFPEARLQVVLTTRDADDWLFSAYRHHLRGQRLTLTADAFAADYAPAADLAAAAKTIAEAIPGVPVTTLPLAALRDHPLGPGGAICELLALPDAINTTLTPVGPGNTGPDAALWQQFLDLNRGPLDDRAVQIEKNRLALAQDLGGWRRVPAPANGATPDTLASDRGQAASK